MAPEVSLSSAAAAVKLEVRAAASKARSHVSVGRPRPTGRMGVLKRITFQIFVAKGSKILACTAARSNLLWPMPF